MTTTPDDWEEMTEKEANENGVFDCPTCGRLRDASEMTPEEADEWAVTGCEDRADLIPRTAKPV